MIFPSLKVVSKHKKTFHLFRSITTCFKSLLINILPLELTLNSILPSLKILLLESMLGYYPDFAVLPLQAFQLPLAQLGIYCQIHSTVLLMAPKKTTEAV